MDLKAQVGIISIFGRGHWLAAELARKGIPVALLEISQQMGNWAPEDWEGPFGFFKSESMLDSQYERMVHGDDPQMVPQGLTVWLKSGPVEMKGATTRHRFAQMGVDPEVEQYLLGKIKVESLKKMTFAQTWVAHLAHAYSSVVATLLPESFLEGKRLPLFSSFYFRHASRQGLEKSLKWCESLGVQVYRNVELKDVALEDRHSISNLEIKTDRQGLFQAEQFVWCLSSEESGLVSSKVQALLFPKGPVEPEWVWVRYRIRMKDQGPLAEMTRAQLPLHCVVIEDLMLPWTHENMMILIRTQTADQFDVWMKIPNSHRFHRQYLEERGRMMVQYLMARIPDNEVQVAEGPQESHYTFEQIGPSRHPVFSRTLKSELAPKAMKNVTMDSPEQWATLGWEGAFDHQNEILRELTSWWTRKEELRKKQEENQRKREKQL
ncbi:MAG: hypothetical protein COT73_11125 [Bdellovibrio sp. CG10_big_fil_rev_8_21_14_0_10_47_8]|nr:MAG: hypothetical protein COT73_11125 [Bdellovibrio sp. CG10_big_fil_rev_8_21_14_0_10_47_8]